MIQPTTSAATRTTPRWHWLYFVLAAFDICALTSSLILNHAIMGIFQRSLETNQAWAERLREAASLGQLAAAVNAPGNDLFASGAIEKESVRLRRAQHAFNAQFVLVRQDLWDHSPAAQVAAIQTELEAIDAAMQGVSREASALFADFRRDDQARAGKHMAAMDRAFVAFNAALTNLQAHIGTVQREQFLQQAQAAARLQMFEYAIGALILAMVAGATMYGLKLARNVQAVERERDRSQEILEARVAERTSALSNANAALQESEQDRARLLRQVLSAQEEERRRIARDLHDEIGQSLTSLVLGLRSLESSADVEEAHYRAGELRGVAANTLDAVRRLARGLRPSVLDDLGLAAALERLASEFRRAPELDVRLQVTEQGRLPAEVETAVYRIVQEALTNTARHANAGQVVVTLQATPPQLRLCIEDNGRGLPGQPGEAPPASSPGFGISGMRERARLLDGSFRIESLPGRGTRIAVEIPVTETVDVEDSRLLDR